MYYGLGVALGVLMVNFFFGSRTDIQCNYFPNDRVLYDIRNKDRHIPDDIQKELDESNVDSLDMANLLEMGNVDFENSQTKLDSCKTYWISFKPDDKDKFSVQFRNCDSLATLIEFRRP